VNNITWVFHGERPRGNCYATTEALYHLLGGRSSGWKPMQMQHEGDSHWFLQHAATGLILDPTVSQFKSPPDYKLARGKGFLTVSPSAAAWDMIRHMVWQGMAGAIRGEYSTIIRDLVGLAEYLGAPAATYQSCSRAVYKRTKCGANLWGDDGGHAILIGAMVEGTDIEVLLPLLRFPFTGTQLDEALIAIDAEAEEALIEFNHGEDTNG